MADWVDDFQRRCNYFTTEWLKGVNPLIVDGETGFLTNRRVRTCEWYLGYDQDRITDLGDVYAHDVEIRRELVRRMAHPRDPQYVPAKTAAVRQAVIERGIERRKKQKARYYRNQVEAWIVPGVTYYNGKPVAKCAMPYLIYARNHGWIGGLNSGWRDPLYSEHLCYIMCGAPTCSGRCAGRSSMHAGSTCWKFAIDVSDYSNFRHIMANMPLDKCPNNHRIFNDLPIDPVHFSPTGH